MFPSIDYDASKYTSLFLHPFYSNSPPLPPLKIHTPLIIVYPSDSVAVHVALFSERDRFAGWEQAPAGAAESDMWVDLRRSAKVTNQSYTKLYRIPTLSYFIPSYLILSYPTSPRDLPHPEADFKSFIKRINQLNDAEPAVW